MKHRVKCPYCDTWFFREQEEFGEHKGRYFHKVCYEIVAEQQRQKDALYAYVIKLFNLQAPGPRILSQVSKYVNDHSYTFIGIHQALLYFYEVKKNTLEKSNGGIGIVPFVYEEAKKHYQREANMRERAMQIGSIGVGRVQEERVIHVVAPTHFTPKKNPIDITQL